MALYARQVAFLFHIKAHYWNFLDQAVKQRRVRFEVFGSSSVTIDKLVVKHLYET